MSDQGFAFLLSERRSYGNTAAVRFHVIVRLLAAASESGEPALVVETRCVMRGTMDDNREFTRFEIEQAGSRHADAACNVRRAVELADEAFATAPGWFESRVAAARKVPE